MFKGTKYEKAFMKINGKYSWVKHLDFMLIDLGSLLLCFFFNYFLKFHTFVMNTEWKRLIVIIVLLNIVINLVANPYSGIFRRRYYQDIGRAVLNVTANSLCLVLIFYVLKIGAEYSREAIILTYVSFFFVSVVLRYIWKRLLFSGKVRTPRSRKMSLVLISTKENADNDIHSIYSTDLQLYDIKGIYLVSGEADGDSSFSYRYGKDNIAVPVIKDDIVKFALDNNIDEVLVCVSPSSLDAGVYSTLIANGVGVDIFVEAMLGFKTENKFVSHIGVNEVLITGTFSFSPSQQTYLFIKRVFDIICGLIGLVVLIPTTLFVKLAYLFSGDTAKIFFRQKRIGLNGKEIRIWKYRSMVPNAGEVLQEMLKEERYRKEWEENQKFKKDPRITKVGNFLRKTSIDELPQLLNVLVGDMSLVGPRPLVEGELTDHDGLKLYQKVKPGLTGWWGCNGRSNIDYRERLELEYYYVKNCSLYLDVLCILRTIWAVLRRGGAQ